MNDKDNYSDKLEDPIFLDYDVNDLKSIIKGFHAEMLDIIKGYFEKSGFERTGETYKGFTIFENIYKTESIKVVISGEKTKDK